MKSFLTVAPLRLTSTTGQALTEDDIAQRRKLRTVKSADSLVSASLRPSRLSEGSEPGATGIAYATKPGMWLVEAFPATVFESLPIVCSF